MYGTTITRVEEDYPKTRSQVKRMEDAQEIVRLWKKDMDIKDWIDEIKYMQQFDGKLLPVYQPSWHNNRHQPYVYQGREMKYLGEETFVFGELSDDLNKMYVIAETDEWLMGFQFIHHIARFNGEQTGFRRLMMQAWHK